VTTPEDPLDFLTHDLSAKRAAVAERRSYEAYADQTHSINNRSTKHWACYDCDLLEARELAGLIFYEQQMFADLQQWLDDNISGLDPSMMLLHGGEFSMAVSAGEPADPVYLLHRQYHAGLFSDQPYLR
jgi:hypothetical protein